MTSVTRRQFLIGGFVVTVLGAASGCVPSFSTGRPRTMPVIGILASSIDPRRSANLDAFKDGLRELDYVEGQSIAFELRNANGDTARLPELAEELVKLDVTVLVSLGSETPALMSATKSIPILMLNGGDPVGQGFVASLSRPGGNVTGLTNVSRQLIPKQLELLRELRPGLTQLAVLWNPANSSKMSEFADLRSAADPMGITLESLEVRSPAEVEQAFDALKRSGVQGLFVLSEIVVNSHNARTADIALAEGLPSIHTDLSFVEVGGLLAFGPNPEDRSRRGATYVDKILRGANPAELPIEQPTTFELIVNEKTSQLLGLTIPLSVLAQATRVMQ
jgi:putative tryptophan/tyrosine transport system substrate-binding protein